MDLGGGAKPAATARNREDENLVSTMYEQNTKLKSQVIALKEKVKGLQEELEKKKKELAVAKKRAQQPVAITGGGKTADRPRSAPDVQIMAAPSRPFDMGLDVSKDGVGAKRSDENLLAIAQKLKERSVINMSFAFRTYNVSLTGLEFSIL